MADQELVHADHRGPAAVVTLDSPHNRNALSSALVEQLHATLAEVVADERTRVVVQAIGEGRVDGAGHGFHVADESGRSRHGGSIASCAPGSEGPGT